MKVSFFQHIASAKSLGMLNRDTVLRALKRAAENYPIHCASSEALRLDFLFIFSSSQPEELELAQKMGEALKLPAERFALVCLSHMDVIDLSTATKNLSAQYIVLFGASKDLRVQGAAELIRAPALSELIAQPDLKRALWQQLKTALIQLEKFK